MTNFIKLQNDCRKAIEGFAQSTSGYGKLFVHPKGRVWFVTADGDESSYAKEIKSRLSKVVREDNVTIEAEDFPPQEDKEWKEVKLKYVTAAVLANLNRIASLLEDQGRETLAESVHDVFLRVAEKSDVSSLVEHQDVIQAEMTLEDALNNYDSDLYRVDPQGNWNPGEWITIDEFMSSLPEGALSGPAAIDANHIAFELPEVGFQVVNLVPKSEWGNEPHEQNEDMPDEDEKAPMAEPTSAFRKELESLINTLSKENGSDTPDFILSEYLDDCLMAFDKAVSRRSEWYGKNEDSVTFVSDEMNKAASAADKLQRYATADAIDLLNARFAKNHGGLDDWFKNEKWVDVRRPKKDGGYEECGRSDTKKGKKPVCTPANKAKNLSAKERKERMKQKSRKENEPRKDKKPKTTTYTDGAGGKSNIS